jgi:hypothetical protein
LRLADLRGFAHLEKIYGAGLASDPSDAGESVATAGDPLTVTELRPVEQWFWVPRWPCTAIGNTTPRRAAGRVYVGCPVDLGRFIVREVDDPVNEIIAKAHVRQEADGRGLGWLSWSASAFPRSFIEGPPQRAAGKARRTISAPRSSISEQRQRLSCPNGAKAHTRGSRAPGSSVFKERLDYLDGQIVIAATSGKLTILSESVAAARWRAARRKTLSMRSRKCHR